MSELAVLGTQSAASPNGRRYTTTEKDAAFMVWRTSAGRSARKVAAILRIDHGRILAWRDSEDWISRANEEDHDDYASSRIGVAAIVVNELVPSIETARQIRDDITVSARDRLAAAQWLAGLAGVSPVSKIETAVTDRRATVIDVTPDFDDMSADQLRDYEHSIKRKTRVVTARQSV